MSGRLPALRGDAVVRALKKAGFDVVRIKGSHHIMEHSDDPARPRSFRSMPARTSCVACCARSSTTLD